MMTRASHANWLVGVAMALSLVRPSVVQADDASINLASILGTSTPAQSIPTLMTAANVLNSYLQFYPHGTPNWFMRWLVLYVIDALYSPNPTPASTIADHPFLQAGAPFAGHVGLGGCVFNKEAFTYSGLLAPAPVPDGKVRVWHGYGSTTIMRSGGAAPIEVAVDLNYSPCGDPLQAAVLTLSADMYMIPTSKRDIVSDNTKALLITHGHADHLDPYTNLRRATTPGSGITVITPQMRVEWAQAGVPAGVLNYFTLPSVTGINIVPNTNDMVQYTVFDGRHGGAAYAAVQNYGYLIHFVAANFTVFHAGDLDPNVPNPQGQTLVQWLALQPWQPNLFQNMSNPTVLAAAPAAKRLIGPRREWAHWPLAFFDVLSSLPNQGQMINGQAPPAPPANKIPLDWWEGVLLP